MKLRPLKIGDLTLRPKMYLSLSGALLIFGMGVGVTVASPGNSKFALILCSLISLAIVFFVFFRK